MKATDTVEADGIFGIAFGVQDWVASEPSKINLASSIATAYLFGTSAAFQFKVTTVGPAHCPSCSFTTTFPSAETSYSESWGRENRSRGVPTSTEPPVFTDISTSFQSGVR